MDLNPKPQFTLGFELDEELLEFNPLPEDPDEFLELLFGSFPGGNNILLILLELRELFGGLTNDNIDVGLVTRATLFGTALPRVCVPGVCVTRTRGRLLLLAGVELLFLLSVMIK